MSTTTVRPVINYFSGKYRFLSNFYPAKVNMDDEVSAGIYPSVEHAFQAAKSLNAQDRIRMQNCATPGEVKRMGRRLMNLRPDWEQIKLRIMYHLVYQKFAAHPELGDKLLATGDAVLIEGNDWGDTFWGVDMVQGQGDNHLGTILMQVRDRLRPKA